jgi:hypothetical protein
MPAVGGQCYMRTWMLIMLLPVVTAALGEEQIRIVETRALPIGEPGAGASHRLRLSLYVFRGGRWPQEEVAALAREAAGLLQQCGVALAGAELRVVQAPPRFHSYFTPLSRELLGRLRVPKPAAFFVDDTLNRPAYDAEAIGRANAAARPELADTIWVAYGARDVAQVLAHELVHVLSDSGEHSQAPDNLMRAETAPRNVRLSAAQCSRLRARGEANGLLSGVN